MSTKFLDLCLHVGSILAQYWLQESVFFESKIALIFWLIFETILAPFWEPFWGSFSMNCQYFFRSKMWSIFRSIFIDFWMDVGGRHPWKWAPRPHDKLILHKIAFSDSGRFVDKRWWNRAPKIEPKWLQKSMKKSEVVSIDVGPIWGGFWESFWTFSEARRRCTN